ncbi:hypothetical protein [Streptococcus ruminantium]|uniref:hypothetical protein n=1 Tax=Streptococcus ruminantium TaxID=1917441 RepID=UPI001F337DF9|nr:hypothetical protein [Streptococcus ruminantium]BDD40077.1 hypothetical protein GUT184_03410 [Streptococcus ruminantium]
MTLNANDKVEIYHLKQLGWTWLQLSQKFDVNKAHLKYLVRLIDKHGLDCVQNAVLKKLREYGLMDEARLKNISCPTFGGGQYTKPTLFVIIIISSNQI